MPSATITIHRIFMSSHLITQLIKKYVSKVNHLIIVIAKKVGIPMCMGPFINDVTHLGERGDLAKGDITP